MIQHGLNVCLFEKKRTAGSKGMMKSNCEKKLK